MKGLLLVTALIALLAPSQKGAVQVKVNANNGDKITGERKFRVTVNSNNPVTQVEFYVGNELRDKDTSTPYEFAVDSLAEADGDLKLRFKAYTTENESGEATVTVSVDNGVSKGAPFHVDKGEAALQDSRWEDAITEGRIALKADSKSNAARIVLARAYLGKGDTAKAQKYAEDAVEADPSNGAALSLLSTINLQAAFKTVATSGGDRKEALTAIKDALSNAVGTRRKALDAAVDKAGQPTTATLSSWADVALRAGRFNLVVPPLRDEFERNPGKSDIANRLAYAYLRLGRISDANTVMTNFAKRGTPDAYGFAVMAIVKAELGDVTGSDDAIKEALLADPDDQSVIAAQAYIALKFVRYRLGNQLSFNLNYDDLAGKDLPAKQESRATLVKLVGQLQQTQAARTETLYYRQAAFDKLGELSSAQKAFQAAVLAEPANFDAYIEEGNRNLASTQLSNLDAENKQQALDYAEIMFNSALIAQADSAQALTGLALVMTIQGKMADAIKWGEAAVRANPAYGSGHLALGTAYNLAAGALRKQADTLRAKSKAGVDASERQSLESQARQMEDQAGAYSRSARDAGVKAADADKRLEGQQLTAAYSAWRFYAVGGRTPVLPSPK